MQMTDEEIKRDWLAAKDRKKQISVLAELNACTEEEVRKALLRAGVDFRSLPKKKTRRTAPNAEAEADAGTKESRELTIQELIEDNAALKKQLSIASRLTEDLVSDLEAARTEREKALADLEQKVSALQERNNHLVSEIESLEREVTRRGNLIVEMVARLCGGE